MFRLYAVSSTALHAGHINIRVEMLIANILTNRHLSDRQYGLILRRAAATSYHEPLRAITSSSVNRERLAYVPRERAGPTLHEPSQLSLGFKNKGHLVASLLLVPLVDMAKDFLLTMPKNKRNKANEKI